MKAKDAIKVLTVRGTNFEAASEGDGSAAIEEHPADNCQSSISEFISQELVKSDRPDLAAAKIVVSGGGVIYIYILSR